MGIFKTPSKASPRAGSRRGCLCKDGKVKGFSIEGYFADKLEDSPRQDMSKNEVINQLKELLK